MDLIPVKDLMLRGILAHYKWQQNFKHWTSEESVKCFSCYLHKFKLIDSSCRSFVKDFKSR